MSETETHDPFTSEAPKPDFAPMPDQPQEQQETFGGDKDGLRAAAEELTKTREEAAPVIERKYVDPESGSDRPDNETVSAKRAARDLTELREHEAETAQAAANDELTRVVDELRGNPTPDAQVEGADVPQPETPSIEPQPEAVQSHDGIDPEIAQALQSSPKLRAALEQTVQAAEQQRMQYERAAQEALQSTAIASIASIPELHGMNADQARVALAYIAKQNSGRYQEIVGHLQRVEQVRQIGLQQAQQQQAQIQQHQQQQQAQLDHWRAAQDADFDRFAKSEPDLKRIQSELPRLAKEHFGIEPDALRHAWNNEPAFRSAPFQKALMFAAKHLLAQEGIQRAPKPVPPVQRPGVSGSFDDADASDVRSASRAFANDPTPRSGAAALIAKRNAAARNR